jgi:transglutaminase-like putative cysteine protease
MKKKIWFLFSTCILILIVVLSGCELLLPPTIYEAAPTRIRYELTYGYDVNSSGRGLYEISYWCDTPEILVGTLTYHLLYNYNYETKTLENNTFIHWNISGTNQQTLDLGITAQVEAVGYLVADLNGEDALSIVGLRETYPEIASQYTRVQGNETIRFIDPFNPAFTAIAHTVLLSAKTNNSFLLAKSLFVWLKQNTQYQTHPNDPGVRPAAITFANKKGDCDDLSFLYISLCRSLDIPARFVRGYLLTDNGNGSLTATAHAWVEVFVGGPDSLNGWIPVECACCTQSIETDVNQNFGVENAYHVRLFVDNGSNESLANSFLGISYVIYNQERTITLQAFAGIQNYQEIESKTLVITSKNNRYYG